MAAKFPRSAYALTLGSPSQGDVFDWMRDPAVTKLGVTRKQLQEATVIFALSVRKKYRGLGIGRQTLNMVTTLADAEGTLLLLKVWPHEIDPCREAGEFVEAQERLKETFYAPAGFVELDGDWMLRQPVAKTRSFLPELRRGKL